MLKKWFCILLMLGFSFTNVYASDDDEEDYEDEDYDEDEEILPATKKLDTKSNQKAKKADDVDGRIGLSAGFDGSPIIGLVYNTGSGVELGLGLGLKREQYTENTKKDGEEDVKSEDISHQEWRVVLDLSYELGKGLLGYGIGIEGVILGSTFENEDGTMDKGVIPYFFVSGELLKNVSLFLKAGAFINMLEDESPHPVYENSKDMISHTGKMNIEFQSSVGLTFYFM